MREIDDGEAALWAESISGNSRAFGLLFDLHRDAVFRHALRLTRGAANAEDITAVVFFELWAKRGRVRVVNGSVRAWLLVATNHVASNAGRAQRRYAAALARLPPRVADDDHAAVDWRLDRAGVHGEIGELFSALAPALQDVVTLCILNEITNSEAARILRLPVGTVKSRLFRAKALLAGGLTHENPFSKKDAIDGRS